MGFLLCLGLLKDLIDCPETEAGVTKLRDLHFASSLVLLFLLVFVPFHCERLTRSSLAICKHGCMIASNHFTYQILYL